MPKFIVSLQDGADYDKVTKDIENNGGTITNDFRPLLNAFAADIPESYLTSLKSLVGGDTIKNLEPDGVVTTQDTLL
ncbi:hypothetical protein P691DRAFT_756493 [Macrolepiota fuliginosa MF-IS2]|uniref:Inhibitor I9 domain-containing protein n=1 Tax=Macrolepiota fuliginosa MF-IS2 TaxID=1400762 RepID=A0A9P6C8Q7_9AGAR|nr:hypothetical protein P691DRAFT_756493 [Macrolepiota fuliginosa MF-IS2]